MTGLGLWTVLRGIRQSPCPEGVGRGCLFHYYNASQDIIRGKEKAVGSHKMGISLNLGSTDEK